VEGGKELRRKKKRGLEGGERSLGGGIGGCEKEKKAEVQKIPGLGKKKKGPLEKMEKL